MNQLYDVEENHSRYANDTSSTMKNNGKGENTWQSKVPKQIARTWSLHILKIVQHYVLIKPTELSKDNLHYNISDLPLSN